MKLTSLTLITACINNASTLTETFDSVRAQTAEVKDYVVVDGGSDDGTLELLQSPLSPATRWVSETDGGIYDALNKGLGMAQGDVVGFLHADDLFADERVLSRVMSVFEDPDVDACYGDLVYVNRTDPDRVIRYWRSGAYQPSRLRHGWMPPHPTFYVRRSLYEAYGIFDTSYRIAADYDCMLRLLTHLKGRVEYIPEVLVRMRVGGESNRSLGNLVRKSREDYRALRANKVGGLGTLAWKNLSKLTQFVSRPS